MREAFSVIIGSPVCRRMPLLPNLRLLAVFLVSETITLMVSNSAAFWASLVRSGRDSWFMRRPSVQLRVCQMVSVINGMNG